ncbi:efflux RND transporter periplasmic adaptor subunit [Sporomusa sp. KB1]|uniref:efflux RND transporter periplasmic adaptor subunit n=1 Tax=Sporomusa sp. KB1 TaxID=943346 RepID=UPI00119FE598|nr:efflux RND transporter periplasmic adaptor subunit [Sporomusa sp. KB1]TWH46174.1 RND family efflux transporter MFP subunit [Sporomusa sp. KB1]
MNRWKTKYWIIPVIVVIGITLVVRSGVFAFGKADDKAADSVLSVKVATVENEDIVPSLTFNSSIEGATSATVSAKIAGRIEQVLAEEGQAVKAGDPLVKLEAVELANSSRQAGDAVKKAQINYELALNDYNRYQRLFDKGAISEQQLDNVRAKLKTAEADVSTAAANQSSAEQQYGYGIISAPVDGVVANKNATIGQVVSPGVALMVVQDINQVYAVINVEQKELGRVKVGQQANITVDTYPDTIFTGTVEVVNPEAGSSSRMFRTKIKIDNDSASLKPGMFAKVALLTGERVAVQTVPQSAVVQKQGLYYVFTVENGKAVRRQIEIGEVTGNTIVVKSGLQIGAQVIVTSTNRIKDGDAVRVAS